MPHTENLRTILLRLHFALLTAEHALQRFMHWGFRLSLVVLAITGEWITHLDSPGSSTLVSIPALRGIHALGAMVLLAVLLAHALDRVGVFYRRWQNRSSHAPLLSPWRWQNLRSLRALMNGTFALLVGLLVVSGLERFWQMRYGGGLLPVLSPFAWYALHRVLPFFLYALLLFLSFNWGRMLLKRMLRYLYAP